MFNMSSGCCDNQGKSLAKLSNNPVGSVLADFVPACGQNFFQMFNILNSLPADNLLKRSSDQIVYGIQIRTVKSVSCLKIMKVRVAGCLRLICIAVVGLGAPQSRFLEGAPYKFLNE